MFKTFQCTVVLALAWGAGGLTCARADDISATRLRCEYRVNPLGIDATAPRLGWQLQAGRRGTLQTAYQVLVATAPSALTETDADLWDSGKVQSDESVHVLYGGEPLQSGQACFWKVRVWDNSGSVSPWSETAYWTMGLLDAADWHAEWIGLDSGLAPSPVVQAQWIWFPEGNPAVSAPPVTRFFRYSIGLPENDSVEQALCYVAADNEFRFFVNGDRVGRGSDFHTATTIDLKDCLKPGINVLAFSVTNHGESDNPAGLLASLSITLSSGKSLTLKTDETWKTSKTAPRGWERKGFDNTLWVSAQVLGENGMNPWGKVTALGSRALPARMLRREFEVQPGIRRGTAYVCGLGLFELYVNGERIGDQVLAPAASEYDKRVYCMTFDVTTALNEGANAVGVLLGNGRYFAPRGTLHRDYGYPKLLLQLEIEHADGTMERVVSDAAWTLTTGGPIRANNEYDGEVYDARLAMPGWTERGFDDAQWQSVELVEAPGGVMAAQMQEPIRVTETVKPKGLAQPAPGVYVFDMGQNLVGWCRLTVEGPTGTTVNLRHAEVTNDDGTLYMANLRSAEVTNTYILKGGGEETYEPRFTYHGFRYVELTGFPGEPDLETLEGCVVHDDVAPAGSFECSNPLLNRIHQNIFWGTRGNYRSMPTDCPQRDERQGWLGDRSEESRGETFLFQIAPLYAKWVQDMDDAQRDTGSVPDVAPSYYPFYNDDVTWPSSFVIIPGVLHDQYRDRRVIERHYDGMKQWIDYMTQFVQDGIISKDSYGDWCVPPEDPLLIHSKDPKRKTDGAVLATAYFYHDLDLMAGYATLLNRPEDSERFGALATTMKDAFNRRFFNADRHDYSNGSQTASILPLAFGLVPEDHEKAVFEALVDKILVGTHGHVGTGLIGGQWLTRVLSDGGRPDVVYTLATQTTYPSWGYMIENGATTIWELWNGNTADPAMNSHNHVMLVGDLVLWFYEYLGGIRPDPSAPGFQRIVLRPEPVGDLTFVNARHNSLYGPIVSEWSRNGHTFRWTVTVPPNAMATVYVPTTDSSSVKVGGMALDKAEEVQSAGVEEGRPVCKIGSGTYTFESELKQAVSK